MRRSLKALTAWASTLFSRFPHLDILPRQLVRSLQGPGVEASLTLRSFAKQTRWEWKECTPGGFLEEVTSKPCLQSCTQYHLRVPHSHQNVCRSLLLSSLRTAWGGTHWQGLIFTFPITHLWWFPTAVGKHNKAPLIRDQTALPSLKLVISSGWELNL